MAINETALLVLNNTTDLICNGSSIGGMEVPITGYLTFDIFLITLVASLFITIVNKYLSDQVAIKALKKEMKVNQKKMRKLMTKDPQKAQKMQKEHMGKSMQMMKHTMNPKIMLITMGPMMIMFFYVRTIYGPCGEFFNFFGMTTFTWFGTYLTFSIINSIIMKKLLDVA